MTVLHMRVRAMVRGMNGIQIDQEKQKTIMCNTSMGIK